MSLMDDRLFCVLMCFIDYEDSHPNHGIDSAGATCLALDCWENLARNWKDLCFFIPAVDRKSLAGALSPVALGERAPVSPAPLSSQIQGQQASISDIM